MRGILRLRSPDCLPVGDDLIGSVGHLVQIRSLPVSLQIKDALGVDDPDKGMRLDSSLEILTRGGGAPVIAARSQDQITMARNSGPV